MSSRFRSGLRKKSTTEQSRRDFVVLEDVGEDLGKEQGEAQPEERLQRVPEQEEEEDRVPQQALSATAFIGLHRPCWCAHPHLGHCWKVPPVVQVKQSRPHVFLTPFVNLSETAI